MIDMRYHELPDWTETVRNEPILSRTDIDNINATKLIMGHHILAFEKFYVHNNIVIYLERKKTVSEPYSGCQPSLLKNIGVYIGNISEKYRRF